MFRGFSIQHGEILEELLAETAGSMVLKTDCSGFIEQASDSIERLGLRLSEMLFRPHLADLTSACHAEAIRAYHQDTIAGMSQIKRLEFPIILDGQEPVWYTLSLRPIAGASAGVKGALGLLRSVEGRRSLEDELSNASMTDAATGLANESAFRAMLAHHLQQESGGTVVIFELDRFPALKLRFGHAMANEMLWAFSRFLINVFPPDDILARLDTERFAVLAPGNDGETTLKHTQDALKTFVDLSAQSAQFDMRLTVSAGIADLHGHAENVLIQAERALVVARALGGNRAELRADVPRWQKSSHAVQ
ncbi:MAG: diguanylate cyclase [Altererythrobacter sp.]|nr:diguanylate cyclase [Altererythrobacter sp.]NNK45140.1 diguanylate cyclase [Altererythrobacter sp.]